MNSKCAILRYKYSFVCSWTKSILNLKCIDATFYCRNITLVIWINHFWPQTSLSRFRWIYQRLASMLWFQWTFSFFYEMILFFNQLHKQDGFNFFFVCLFEDLMKKFEDRQWKLIWTSMIYQIPPQNVNTLRKLIVILFGLCQSPLYCVWKKCLVRLNINKVMSIASTLLWSTWLIRFRTQWKLTL